jgi:DNA-directed RNA polymerase subunit beta'
MVLLRKYLVPLTRQILAQDGDFVKAGTALSDGSTAPADILAIKGPFAVQEYVVNEIQEVYRLQGVRINDKHIEVIVRQMMKKVEIQDPGDTRFLEGDTVDRIEFNEENDYIYDKKVVVDAGESTKLKAGQIVSLREVREENSILRRSDRKLVEFRDAHLLLHLHCCLVSLKHHWCTKLDICGFVPGNYQSIKFCSYHG